ncbi:hypothetical protein [Myceligenerans xiligouense]|uniref:Uncharacterized protein n=1 Tax=Myceligenerans xiligouense TaxID=253184 RepID=A0A3N4YS82_9MICO|nr:hypothetical protein [Myceligenerans xiligouense]RPF21410.1 hypothetical protein EDD34_2037 [Myceligenerans xiligouense]
MTDGTAWDETTQDVRNTARTAGIQAHYVRDSTVNQYFRGDDPQDVYQAGVRYLEDGAVTEARKQIQRAMHSGHDNAEVRFRWILAMLSKRKIQDLSAEERETLAASAQRFASWCRDRNAADQPGSTEREADHVTALAVVSELATSLLEEPRDSERVTGVEKRVLDLPDDLRASVGRHLGQVMQTAAEEKLWHEAVEHAREGQLKEQRAKRAWIYFEPPPALARVRTLHDPRGNHRWVRPVLGALPVTALVVLGVGHLVRVALTSLVPGAIIATIIALAGATFLAWQAFEWCYRTERLGYEERARGSDPLGQDEIVNNSPGRTDGFAHQVTRYFEYYFGRYRPAEFRQRPGGWRTWLTTTERVRRYLRNEVERLYRHQSVQAEEISWLIRHLASDVAKRWSDEDLYDFRERYAVSRRTKARALLSGLVAAGALLVVMPVVWQTAWFSSLLALVTVSLSIRPAVRRWYAFARDIRWHQDDMVDVARDQERRQNAYLRWKQKLEPCPTESEMAAWFACDTTLLVDEALQAFGVTRGDIVSHVVLSAKMPTGSSYRVKSTRDAMGPWRYSRYELSVFLVLPDGLHEYTRRWNFEEVKPIGAARRFHFEFEKIESGFSPNDRHVRLKLIGGTVKEFAMSGDGTIEPEGQPSQDSQTLEDDDYVESPELTGTAPELQTIYRDASGLVELRRTFEKASHRRAASQN